MIIMRTEQIINYLTVRTSNTKSKQIANCNCSMERAIVARHDNKNIAHMRIVYQHTETWIP